jgi:hypothetical protein
MTEPATHGGLLHAADLMYTVIMQAQDFLQRPRGMIEYLLEPWLDDPTALITPVYPVMLLYDFAVALNMDEFFLAELPQEAYEWLVRELDARLVPADANGAGTISSRSASDAGAGTARTLAGRRRTARDTHG